MTPPLDDNPVFVLELDGPATSRDVERQKAKLLALIEANDGAPRETQTPFGMLTSTADDIRQAAAQLQTPKMRLWCTVWAEVFRKSPPTTSDDPSSPRETHFDALAELHWWTP